MTAIRSRLASLTISTLLLGVALPLLASVSGCKKKTPAEKFGDKIEDVGEDVGDAIEEGTDG